MGVLIPIQDRADRRWRCRSLSAHFKLSAEDPVEKKGFRRSDVPRQFVRRHGFWVGLVALLIVWNGADDFLRRFKLALDGVAEDFAQKLALFWIHRYSCFL